MTSRYAAGLPRQAASRRGLRPWVIGEAGLNTRSHRTEHGLEEERAKIAFPVELVIEL